MIQNMLNWLAGINAFKGGPGGLVVAVSYPGGRLAPHQVRDDLELLRVDVAVAVQVEHLQARRKSLRLEWLTLLSWEEKGPSLSEIGNEPTHLGMISKEIEAKISIVTRRKHSCGKT